MDATAFLRALDTGRVPPVILVHGPVPFLVEDVVAAVSRAALPDGEQGGLVREALDLREAGPAAVARAAQTLPFLGPRRLVIARGLESLPARGAEPLAEYLERPNPSTVLVLVAAEELPGSHWALRLLPPAAVAAVAPLGRGAAGWLRIRARRDGLEVTEPAAALLAELVGDDPTRLLAEAEKAAVAGGPDNRRVGPAEVRAAVGDQRVRRLYELSRAVEQRELGAALAVCEALLGAGEDPLAILGVLSRESQLLLEVRRWRAAGRSSAEVARELRRPERAAAAFIALAERSTERAVRRRLEACWETERRLKSGGAGRPELALLLAELCAS